MLRNIFLQKVKAFFKAKNDHERNERLDKKLVYSLAKNKIPNLSQIKYLNKFLSLREKKILKTSLLLIMFSFVFIGARFYFTHLEIGPIVGGSYSEAVVGAPKNINPLYYGINDVDNDLVKLIFASLFKRDQNGDIVNDLVQNYEIKNDGLEYDITLKNDVYWHDDEKLSSEDVLYTFNTILNKQYQSPLRPSLLGVKAEIASENEIKFILSEKYAGFLELLTFGILPKHLWSQIPSESAHLADLNIQPVGAGPYKFKSLVMDKSTGRISSYNLELNKSYYDNPSYVEYLSFIFYPNFEEAVASLNDGRVDGLSYLPHNLNNKLVAKDSLAVHKLNLPQLFALLINQEKNVSLKEKAVRKSLEKAINKEELVSRVFSGNAEVVDGPILPESFAYGSTTDAGYNPDEAKKMLDDAGWTEFKITEQDIASSSAEGSEDEKNIAPNDLGVGTWRYKEYKGEDKKDYLKIQITTLDLEENRQVVNLIKSYWENIGVKVDLKFIDFSEINSKILQPRDFEVLFYGQQVGYNPDLFSFWHSTQVGAEGLNLSNYANSDVDKLLEEGREEIDKDKRKTIYNKLQKNINNDTPAIFLYSPTYTYIQTKKINDFKVKNIIEPSDRFNNIENWYVDTGKKIVWK